MFYTIFMYLITERLCLPVGKSSTIDIKNVIENLSVPENVIKQAIMDMKDVDKFIIKFRAKNLSNISRKSAPEVYKERIESICEIIYNSPVLEPEKIYLIAKECKPTAISKNIFAKLYEVVRNVCCNTTLKEFDIIKKLKQKIPEIDGNPPEVALGSDEKTSKTNKKSKYTSAEKKAAEKYFKEINNAYNNYLKCKPDEKIIVKNHYDPKKSEELYTSIGETCEKLTLLYQYYKGIKNSEKLEEFAEKSNKNLVTYMKKPIPSLNSEKLKKYADEGIFLLSENANNNYKSTIETILKTHKERYENLYRNLHNVKIKIKGDKHGKTDKEKAGTRELNITSAELKKNLKKLKQYKDNLCNLENFSKRLINIKPSFEKELKSIMRQIRTKKHKYSINYLSNLCNDISYEIKYGQAVQGKGKNKKTTDIFVIIKLINDDLDIYYKTLTKLNDKLIHGKSIENIKKSLNSLSDLVPRLKKDESKINNLNGQINGIVSLGNNDIQQSKYIATINSFLNKNSAQIDDINKKCNEIDKYLSEIEKQKSSLGISIAIIKYAFKIVLMITAAFTKGLQLNVGIDNAGKLFAKGELVNMDRTPLFEV